MLFLALDTATDKGSLALLEDDQKRSFIRPGFIDALTPSEKVMRR